MTKKASQIAAMFVRKRGRAPASRHTPYFTVKTSGRRRDSSDEEGCNIKRSRSRSINTQTDDRDFEKRPLKKNAVATDNSCPVNVKIESKIEQSNTEGRGHIVGG